MKAEPSNFDQLIYTPSTNPVELVTEWLDRPALQTLVEQFGGAWPSGSAIERLRSLVDFSAVWDRRQGASRLDIVELNEESALAAQVLQCAAELGLVEQPSLSRAHYDWVLVLGGLSTSCLARVEAVAALLQGSAGRPAITAGGIALLGSFRELQDAERAEMISAGLLRADNEVDLLMAASDRWLGTAATSGDQGWHREVSGDPEADPRQAALRAIAPTICTGITPRDGAPTIRAFASASSDPATRPANTADTYITVSEAETFEPGQSVLLVTSRIYRYQWLDAVRVLGWPCQLVVEAYGTRSGAESRRDFGPSWYLQEVRSMFRSSLGLLESTATADN